MKRYCFPYIEKDLKNKMVFLGGPRQAGKTTLGKALLAKTSGVYFNWDNDEDRRDLLGKQWRADSPLVVFDELHKYPLWKRWIKGCYDVKPDHQQYFVTGSARLDLYKKGGDSLLGRYHYLRLHPLTIDEIPEHMPLQEAYERLLSVGGFPEPFLSGDQREARRWRQERFQRVLREDVRDLEKIREIQLLQLFVDSLRTRVGGLTTLANIAADVQISPKTAKSWLTIAENMYLCFAVYPYTTNLARSILKPPKVYFFDNADTAENSGMRLENLVATTLLKRLHFLEDYYGYRCALHYVRDKDGREVDFLTLVDGKIHELIEVKSTDSTLSSSLKYYAEKLKPTHAVQLVGNLKRSFDKDNIHVAHPRDYFTPPLW